MMMSKKKVFLFIFEGFADCETSYLLSNLIKHDQFMMKTIAINKVVKRSLSGLSVMPDLDFMPRVDLQDIDEDNTALVILPGGNGWKEKQHDQIMSLIMHCVRRGITVAASGEATLLLADLGLLDKINHTSISANYLNAFSSFYNGKNNYVNSLSIYEKGIATASGDSPIDFSNTVLKVLDVDAAIEQSFYEEMMFG